MITSDNTQLFNNNLLLKKKCEQIFIFLAIYKVDLTN